ncbi:unnamed protein product [Bursaphelenchus okinawaensis]|uniref:Uncharacterized protein n=1 Tax=Bursaphelenchus okinawaensis TaxID=465554 RepID=A0A811L6W5_9BILA|nr:unnamed protein product [Bursaphelenchus okinawaensis]CAG9119475.1 unnamed protein product [Bursaphelenchus okinawaensis]
MDASAILCNPDLLSKMLTESQSMLIAQMDPLSLSWLKKSLVKRMMELADLQQPDISVGKTYPRDYRAKHASAKRKRARSSQSSTLSNYEPMPTIYEESDSDLASIQSTIHRFGGLHLSPSNNTLTTAA